MKLKTLKDLQKDYEWNYTTYKALKAEAVKWIKAHSTHLVHLHYWTRKWIKHFFNITEEDLK